MLKISYAGCPGLYPAMSPQFTLELGPMRRSGKSQKNHKTSYF